MAFVVGELSAPITLDDKGFKAGLDSVNKAGKTAAEQVSESFKRTGSQMKDVGKTLTTRVTLPIAGIGAAAIRAGMDFDTQMSKVQAISGATGSDLAALREKAKEMGAATRFSATESAEALEYMALAGWDTQQMLDGLPGVLDLAAAGALDLGLASDIVTDGMLNDIPKGCRFSTRCPFADELCFSKQPELKNYDKGQKVRCLHAEKLAKKEEDSYVES